MTALATGAWFTSTVMVRGLSASGDIGFTRLWRAVAREFYVSALIACTLAVMTALVFFLYDQLEDPETIRARGFQTVDALFPLVAAMVVFLAWAGFVGGMVPVACHLTKMIDPAVASGPFVTITCDISASVIFLLFIHFFLAS